MPYANDSKECQRIRSQRFAIAYIVCVTRRRINTFGHMLNRWTIVLWFVSLAVYAQDTQFLPEVDTHLTVSPNIRTYLQAKDDRAGGNPQQFTFGPSIQFSRKPLLKLKEITLFDLDDLKSSPAILESGYRIITAPDTTSENRMLEAVSFHYPFVAGILFSDRNRVDLDWQGDEFTWRYRNKLTVERAFSIHSYHAIPYLAAEPFYEGQYSKWSATDLYVGSLFPLRRHTVLDSYYEHENNTGRRPNRQNHFIGLTLRVYFSLENKFETDSLRR